MRWYFVEENSFYGSTTVTLDAKYRLSIPACHRDDLKKLCEGKMVLATHWTGVRGLMLFPRGTWGEMIERLQQRAIFDKSAQDMRWRLMGKAALVEMDVQGRLLVPETQRSHAGLGKEVLFTGYGTYFELWDPLSWEQHYTRVIESPIPDDFGTWGAVTS